MKTYQKAAALALVQALFAGCSGGDSSGTDKSTASAPPAPASAPASTSSPSITAQPVDASVLTGASATFSVTAAGSSPTYQWKKNGADISGATSATYTAPAATWQDDGTVYTVVVSNALGSATSTAATLHLKLSGDQATYESFALASAGGIFEAGWFLSYTGGQTSGRDYLYYDDASLAQSPLTHGPQTASQSAPVNMTTTLSLPTGGVTRILKNGVILVVPDLQASSTSSYVGSGVQVDSLAADNQTVAFSRIRSGYASLALSGLLHAAPTELQYPYNAIFANAGVLDPNATWAPGSAYLRFTQTALGDRYKVFDCTANATTTGNSPAPCATGTTLAAAMAAGETSNSDGKTYYTADGQFSTVGGVSLWVATQRRPMSATGYTVEYRVYFEMAGNVYTGSLIKDGTVESTAHYWSNPSSSASVVYLNYNVRLNTAAMHSLAAASLL